MHRSITTAAAAAVLIVATAAGAADLFRSPAEKAGFLVALESQHARYDPAEKMIRRPFSSPGYHTTLEGGYVHPTRDSFRYAVALLDSGDPEYQQRACDILDRCIDLQDQDPDSRTYGIWSWFMEEPLDKMSPPDWNWADFCGTQLLQVAVDHMHRLPEPLRKKVRESIIHAARSIIRRNVGPGYTNIAIMGTYVTLVAGERFDNAELFDYGRKRLRRFCEYTREKGSFSEYNSSTYTVVAVEEITRMLTHVRDPECRELIENLNRFAWLHIGRHFHAPTRQWAGPNSRSYRTFLRSSDLAFIQRATGSNVKFVDEDDLYDSTDAHRLRAVCPPDYYHYFTDLPEPRLEVETFGRNGRGRHDIVGTTYMHPDFCLGTVNIGDLWNQRRPVLAYFKTPDGPLAMRIRCLHDDYDYSSASIFTVQDKANALSVINFATDRGDTHISLDRLKNGCITAEDLRVRIQFEGPMNKLALPEQFQVAEPVEIGSGPTKINLQIPFAGFDDNRIRTEITKSDNKAALDIILYSGPKRRIDFNKIDTAAVALALSLNPQPTDPPARAALNDTTLTAHWHNLKIQTPSKPAKTTPQTQQTTLTTPN